MLFLVLMLIVIPAIFVPFIVFISKRSKMLKRICFVAKSNGYKVRYLHRFVAAARNCSNKYDILIENKSEAFAIKLWSARSTKGTLVINEGGKCYELNYVADPFGEQSGKRAVKATRTFSVPLTLQNFKLPSDKQITYILLCYTMYRQIVIVDKDKRAAVEVGDRIFGKIFCSPAKLERLLQKT